MLMSFLDKVVEKKEITKMDPQNLATVLGPTLLRPKGSSLIKKNINILFLFFN